MHPESPQFSDKNQHYSMAGVNPTYYTDNTGTQEEQVAPLIASNIWSAIGVNLDYDVQDVAEGIIPDALLGLGVPSYTAQAYAIDKSAKVYGITSTAIPYYSLTPDGASAGLTGGGVLKCFAGYLLCIPTSVSNNVYKMPLPNGSWSLVSTFTHANVPLLENFLEYCMVTGANGLVKKIDSSFAVTGGLNFGPAWTIQAMRNYNDKYLAIVGTQGNYNNNYLFLWDGISSRYNYSVKMAGKFMDMKVIDGTLYVAVWVNATSITNPDGTGKTTLYYLKGTQLVEVTSTQTSTIKNGFKKSIFNFFNRIGLNLYSNDLLIHKPRNEQFILSETTPFDIFSETYSGLLLGIAGPTPYYYKPISTTYNPISYTSQWIPVKNLQGLDIYYDTPPQSGTDKISVTIYADGENIITGTQTITLNDITPSNHLNNKRHRLDVKGFAGDKCKIVLTTTNAGTWRPIIRQIDLITK